MAISPCRSCGTELSWEETVCPHCGLANPIDYPWAQPPAPRWSSEAVVRLLVGCLVLALAGAGVLLLLAQFESLFRTSP